MPNQTRRAARTSVAAIVAAHADRQAGPLPVPDHVRLPPGAMPFWDAIVSSRPRAEWTGIDLVLAGQCASLMMAIQREHDLLAEGRLVVRTRAGRPRPNVHAEQMLLLTARQLSLMRALGLAGSRAARRARPPEPAGPLLAD